MEKDPKELRQGYFKKAGSRLKERLLNLKRRSKKIDQPIGLRQSHDPPLPGSIETHHLILDHNFQSDAIYDDGTRLQSISLNPEQNNILPQSSNTEDMCLTNEPENSTADSHTSSNVEPRRCLPGNALLGRRIVDFQFVAPQMVCLGCQTLLHLTDFCGDERRYGIASEIPLMCHKCKMIRFIYTSSDSYSKKTTPDRRHNFYDVNCKLIVAMWENGLGPSHINSILSTLNVPTVSHNTISRHEEIVGEAIALEANKSMTKAVELEVMLTWLDPEKSLKIGIISKEEHSDFVAYTQHWFEDISGESLNVSTSELNNDTTDIEENEMENFKRNKHVIPDYVKAYAKDRTDRGLFNPIAASMDAAWLTRGNGKFTKSKSGHAELIGVFSGEVLASGRRHAHCQGCRTSDPGDHVCHANWSGSSKAMEADIIAELVVSSPSFLAASARVVVLVGDEDASTMAKVNEIVPWKVQKVTDYVHGKKNFGGALFALRHKLLNSKIIDYLRDCFSYALHQNENDQVALKSAIMNIPFHVFDQHDKCGQWCGYQKDPKNYQHKRLPRLWKGTEDDRESLKGCLIDVCAKFAAKSCSLAACLTSNTNESFNFLVTTLAPKSRHYGGSFSLDRRIDSAVLKKNDGVQYVVRINKSLGLSPGQHTEAFRKRVAIERKRKIDKTKLPEEKLKRRKLFKIEIQTQLQKEAKEGVQYRTALGFENVKSSNSKTTHRSGDPVMFERETRTVHNEAAESPDAIHTVSTECLGLKTPDSSLTSGMHTPSTTLKPTAVRLVSKKPQLKGTKAADRIKLGTKLSVVVIDTETTGLSNTDQVVQLAAASKSGSFNKFCVPSVKISSHASQVNKLKCRAGKLYQNGIQIQSVSKNDMILSFIKFLEEQEEKVLLVGHNVKFDLRILEAEIKRQNQFEDYKQVVAGYCDSISFFKFKMPGLKSYKLKSVCTEVFGPDFAFDAHDALGDVMALNRCLTATEFSEQVGIEFSVSTISHIKHKQELEKVAELTAEFKAAGTKISRSIIQSLVRQDFNLETLRGMEKATFMSEVKCCFTRQSEKRCEELYSIITNNF